MSQLPLPPRATSETARHQPRLLPGRPPFDTFERDVAQARFKYEYCRNNARVFSGLGSAAGVAGVFAPPANMARFAFEIIAKSERECMRKTYSAGFDPDKLTRVRARLAADGKPRSPAELATAMAKSRRTYFRDSFDKDFNALDPEQQGVFLQGAAKLLFEAIDYEQQEFDQLKKEVGEFRVSLDDFNGQVAALNKLQKSVGPLLESSKNYGELAVGQLQTTSDMVNARIARETDSGVRLLLLQQFETLSGEDKLTWLESGLLGMNPNEFEAEKIKAQRQARTDAAQSYVNTATEVLEGVAAGVNLLANLKVLSPELAARVNKAVQFAGAAMGVAMGIIAQNPMMVMGSLGGMFGGGDSGAASRHAEIMAALRQIQKSLQRIEETLYQMQWDMQLRHVELLNKLYENQVYLKGIYRIVQNSALETSRLLSNQATEIAEATTTPALHDELTRANVVVHIVEKIEGATEPTSKALGEWPQPQWHSLLADSTGNVIQPPAVLRSWTEGVIRLHQMGLTDPGDNVFVTVLPYLARPDHWSPPTEELDPHFRTQQIGFLTAGNFLNSLLINEHLSDFETLLAQQPFLSFPDLLLDRPTIPPNRLVLERYNNSIKALMTMERLLDHALIQEALIAGSYLAEHLVITAFRCGELKSGERKPEEWAADEERERLRLGHLERGYHQEMTHQFLAEQKPFLVQGALRDNMQWQNFVEFVLGEPLSTTNPDPNIDQMRGPEGLLRTISENVGRRIVHILVEHKNGKKLGLSAYAKAWRSPEVVFRGNGMELLFASFPQWANGFDLAIPETFSPLIRRHYVSITPYQSHDGMVWRIERVLAFTRTAHSKGEFTEIRRCIVELPPPEAFLVRDPHHANLAAQTSVQPIPTGAWRSLALLRNRVVSLRADFDLAVHHPEAANTVASLVAFSS